MNVNDDFSSALTSGSVVFAEGETVKTITVNVQGDAQFEDDESVTIDLVDAADAGNTATATGTITNDDSAPTIVVDSPSVVEGDTGTTALTFTVTRTGDAEDDQTVHHDRGGQSECCRG